MSPYDDPLTYRSISELNSDDVLSIYTRSIEGGLARDIDQTSPKSEFDDMIQFADSAYHPETWLVGYLNNEPVGVVFAQRYHDKLEEGSLFVIAVLPEFRGQGFGKILHAKGLEALAGIGVREYVGSTDVNNPGMIRIFEANGCRLYAVRDIEIKVGLV